MRLEEAATLSRLLRVAASVVDVPMSALFRFEGERASLVDRVMRLEHQSEITQLHLATARLRLDERRIWHAAQKERVPAEMVVFSSSQRVAWMASIPLRSAAGAQVGLLVLADLKMRADMERLLDRVEDVRFLIEQSLAKKPASDSRRGLPERKAWTTNAARDREWKQEESSSERRIPLDLVTGLPDRATMMEETMRRLERAEVLQTGVAFVIVALDRFRRVNETLGQSMGDGVLRQVGERLREAVGEHDLVGRRAGDEFLVVLADDGASSIHVIVDQLQQSLREPFHVHGHEILLSASIAVVRYPTDASEPQALFRCADIALARAKQSGRGKTVVFDKAMQDAVSQRAEIERELRVALREGQLVLHYQPKFRIADRRMVGCEALARWKHPTKGLVSPGQFIPVAEDSGLIVPLGSWALGEVCRQADAWRRAGLDAGRVSVNVSALQFARPDFVGTVKRSLGAAGIPGSLIELELTESIVMDDVEHVAQRLRELRALGVAISIDDFGTGYSSLGYLRSLPLDVLKIDRAFVKPLDQGGEEARGAQALAGSIATLARGLGLEVLAEGVETEEQLAALEKLGCEVIQGFLLGRPVPADQLAATMRPR